jgi:Mrp family chromosome partitioning ATPase/capsular polysaccharide biosynthesis protein
MRRRWPIVALAVIVGVALGAGSALAFEDDSDTRGYYKATTTLILEEPSALTSSGSNDSSSPLSIDVIALRAVQGDVPAAAAQQLGTSETSLTERTFVVTDPTLDTLEITVAGRSSRSAEQAADTLADVLMAEVSAEDQQDYSERLEELRTQHAQIEAEVADLSAQVFAGNTALEDRRDALSQREGILYDELRRLEIEGLPSDRLTTFEAAEGIVIDESEYSERIQRGQAGDNLATINPSNSEAESTEPTGAGESSLDSPVERGVLGGVFGLLVGIGLVLLSDQLDQRLRSRDQAEAAFGWPVLAEVPTLSRSQQRHTEVMSRTSPLSKAAEAYRAVRTSLLFRNALDDAASNNSGNGAHGKAAKEKSGGDEKRSLVVMVASPGPGEGKTTTSANLAAIFAESGSSVLVMNCDFRRPRLHRYFGCKDQPQRILKTRVPGVHLVTNVDDNPAANPTTVVTEQRRTVTAVRGRFDVIILDTAALLATSDALELLPAADVVVVVARAGVTSHAAADRTHESLSRLGAPVAGVVFVAAEDGHDSRYYYYSRETSKQAAQVTRRDGYADNVRVADVVEVDDSWIRTRPSAPSREQPQ